MPLASVLPSAGTTSALLERESQVAALQALAETAMEGGGRFVVIEGSAGLGKTRLLAETRTCRLGGNASAGGPRAASSKEFAYGIVRQLFEPLLASATAVPREELLSGPAALVEPLFTASELAGSDPAPEEGPGSFAFIHGLYWLAANVAFEQPTLLAIDDLHWADTLLFGGSTT